MASYLNSQQVEDSHGWIYDMCWLSDYWPNLPKKRADRYWDIYYFSKGFDKADATAVIAAIMGHQLDYKGFVSLDETLQRLKDFSFGPNFMGKNTELKKSVKKSATMLASYVANFCAEKGIYWDNTNFTSYEMDEIRKTVSGDALWAYKCFLSQANGQTGAKPANDANPAGQASKQPPKNSYKSMGPLSQQLVTLVGSPNTKIHPTADKVYCINADKLGKNVPNIYVTPVSQFGTSVGTSEAQAVKLGSGNGYSDCKLWWDDRAEADKFLQKCLVKFGNGKFQNLRLEYVRPDSNGYFKVTTEFGEALIKANKLNECVKESLEEVEADKPEAQPDRPVQEGIRNIDVYDWAFNKFGD